ncbi:MAG: hypothetical protein PHS48_02055 [Bacteroidales bacterium]|nr:hypothetical protein [Bacteroidales bacterium]
MKTKLTFLTIFLIVIFYICWGVPQLINIKTQNLLLSNLLFSIIFTGVIGCFIPIYFKNRFHWNYNKPSSNRIIGYLFLILAIIFSTILSGALFKVIELKYSWIIIIKYILLFFPMSLGIGLFAFLLIPNTLQDWTNNRFKGVLLIISISIFFFFSFYIDSLFQDLELAGSMGFIGLLLGLSYLFLRKFWIVYSGLFIIMLVNTLANNKYDEYKFWIVIISTLVSLTILMFDFIKNRKKRPYFFAHPKIKCKK